MKKLIKKPFEHLSRHLGLWKEAVHHITMLEMVRQRVIFAGIALTCAFSVIGFRLIDVMIFKVNKKLNSTTQVAGHDVIVPRGDIYDRNGNILATHLVTASVYANSKVVLNPKEAAEKLCVLFPDVGFETLYNRLTSGRGFIWIARHITPKIQQEVNGLGIPGIYLQKDYKRVYPYGALSSHVVGYCGIDNEGLAGIEKFFNTDLLTQNDALHLSIDIRIQHIVRDALIKAIQNFQAVAANAMIIDIKSGELLAMVSLPDFDPNKIGESPTTHIFNRNTLGVYEPGSSFKILNTAIALESGHAKLTSLYDAREPVKLGRFTITDFKGKGRVVNLTEAFVYSSNIAAIKIAQQFGIDNQKSYMKKFGVFRAPTLEISEIGQPIIPSTWREPTLMTASYGYGLSVSPLHLMTIIASIMNDGYPVKPTLLYQNEKEREQIKNTKFDGKPIVSKKTSRMMRELMRMAVRTKAKKADVLGYKVFGKTGTAYQSRGRGGYGTHKSRTNTFVGAFPFDDPQFMVIVTLDDPKASKETYFYATAGWNAAPTAGDIISRVAPLLGLHPSQDDEHLLYVNPLESEGFVHTKHVVAD
jgi:cell division protein FtsI (penicillin-binding protein 3)